MTLRPPCKHRREQTRESLCRTCPGHVELKVFACDRHGECTLGKRVADVAGCCDRECSSYEATEA